MSLMHNKGLRVSKSSLFLLKYCWAFVTKNKKARGALEILLVKKKRMKYNCQCLCCRL